MQNNYKKINEKNFKLLNNKSNKIIILVKSLSKIKKAKYFSNFFSLFLNLIILK